GGAVAVAAGLVGSSVLAAAGGLLTVQFLGFAQPAPGLLGQDTLTALAAVTIGGVSLFGRRGGVLGTVLGVLVVLLTQRLILLHGAETGVTLVVLGGMLVAGLVVTRLMELAGRRVTPDSFGP
ncbi:MAG TPA: hypothetical protein VGD67_16250, partial [Pseudonocardiaceae bacterium]